MTDYLKGKKKEMENTWIWGQRSAAHSCSLCPAVQTEESIDSDAWLSQREGDIVSVDINLPPLTLHSPISAAMTPKVWSEGRASRGGGRCKLQWEGPLEVTPYCNLWTGVSMERLWHSPRIQLQGGLHSNHMTQQNMTHRWGGCFSEQTHPDSVTCTFWAIASEPTVYNQAKLNKDLQI